MWFSWFNHDKDGQVNAADLERAQGINSLTKEIMTVIFII
jgi:hypothetical protein